MTQKLKVGWHREHFLSPLLQLAKEDDGKTFELVECPGGTGEMQVKLREGEIDVCIGMWCNLAHADISLDGCIDCRIGQRADFIQAGRAVYHQSTEMVSDVAVPPLMIRAVITGKDTPYHSISDLKGTTFGISRLGSGSQVMASVLGMNEGWSGEDQPKFKGSHRPYQRTSRQG